MPRFTVHASAFPFGIPHKRLETIEAPSLEAAQKQAEAIYPHTSPIVQPEGQEIEGPQPLRPRRRQ